MPTRIAAPHLDISTLRAAAKTFSSTYDAHLLSPDDVGKLAAWDKASLNFNQLIENHELDIILLILLRLETLEEATGLKRGLITQPDDLAGIAKEPAL